MCPSMFPSARVLQDALLQRCFAAEALRCVAASEDGGLCAAGGASGRIYVWQAGSGRLLRSWTAHYKVSCFCTAQGHHLVRCGGCHNRAHRFARA